MKNNHPIGVFDSGIGGLSVLKQFLRFIPYEKYIYLGDTARVPYGNKSAETVIEYSIQSSRFLVEKGAKMIVIACNTASSVALQAVRDEFDIPVIGMIEPAAQAALHSSQNNKIGIIGTYATISSNAYDKAINEIADKDSMKIYSKACPLFVPFVEEGWLRHKATSLVAAEYLNEMTDNEIDTLVLGCTHYPLLKQLIADILPGVNLIDTGEHAAVSAIRILGEAGILAAERNEFDFTPDIELFVTDVPATFYDVAKRFLGFDVKEPIRVNI